MTPIYDSRPVKRSLTLRGHRTSVSLEDEFWQAFREMARVARPGCALVCLEVARPNNPLLRLGHRIYFEQIVPRITRLLGGDPTAYTYLPQSARAFPPPDTLARIMQQAGWSEVRYALLGMGAVAVHTAFKQR